MRATLALNGLIRDVRFDFYFRTFHVNIIYLFMYLFIFSFFDYPIFDLGIKKTTSFC